MDQNKNQKTGSKYFKPGFIFSKDKDVAKASETSLKEDDFINDDELNEVISQACSQLKQPNLTGSQPSTSSSLDTTIDRINQIESQQVDFTSKSISSIPSLKGGNTILVNPNQKQNPLLQNLKSTRYVINESISPAHYVLFDSCCALFLSLKYHAIHPDFIYERINELKNKFQLKILLVLIDHIVYESILKELSILSVRTNFTMMLAWNYEEAAKHIENYRLNADKPPDVIMGRSFEENSKSNPTTGQQGLVDALTSIKSVNRTDAVTLLSTFESLANVIHANTDELTICPGISIVKARRLHSIFHRKFIKQNQ